MVLAIERVFKWFRRI